MSMNTPSIWRVASRACLAVAVYCACAAHCEEECSESEKEWTAGDPITGAMMSPQSGSRYLAHDTVQLSVLASDPDDWSCCTRSGKGPDTLTIKWTGWGLPPAGKTGATIDWVAPLETGQGIV